MLPAGLDVTVTLVAAPNATLPEGCAAKAAAQKCTIKSGTASAAACQITLPCPGEFRLQGCTSASSSSGSSCSSDVLLGRNSTWWDNVPWNSQLGMNLILDKEGEYELGKEVGVQVQNPWWGPTSAMVIWGNAIARKTLMVDKVSGDNLASWQLRRAASRYNDSAWVSPGVLRLTSCIYLQLLTESVCCKVQLLLAPFWLLNAQFSSQFSDVCKMWGIV